MSSKNPLGEYQETMAKREAARLALIAENAAAGKWPQWKDTGKGGKGIW